MKDSAKFSSRYAPAYTEWAHHVEETVHKIRAGVVDPSTVVPVLYFVGTLLLAGLVWFIIYVDNASSMPKEAPEGHPLEGMGGIEGDDEGFDYDSLINKRRQADQEVIIKGSTDRYNWSQGAVEIDVYVPVPDNLPTKAIKVDVKSSTLKISFGGELFIDGTLYDEVVPSECNWQIETVEGGSVTDRVITRKVWLTLQKRTASQRNQFWPCLLHGDPEVDVRKLGPSIVSLDPDDPASFRGAIDRVKSSVAAQKRAAAAAAAVPID